MNKVPQIILQRETSWKWAHFRDRHSSVAASLQYSLGFLQPPIPAPLSAKSAFPEGAIQAYRVPYVTHVRLDARYSAESVLITKEYWTTFFPLSLPFGHSVKTTSAVSHITHLTRIHLCSSY